MCHYVHNRAPNKSVFSEASLGHLFTYMGKRSRCPILNVQLTSSDSPAGRDLDTSTLSNPIMPFDPAQPKEAPWARTATYLKAASFLAPPLFIWTALTIWVTPKVKQICADADAPPFAAFKIMDFAQDNWLILTAALLAGILLLEWKSALWRRWRKYTVATAVFLINTTVIVGMASLLVIVGIAAPMLINR